MTIPTRPSSNARIAARSAPSSRGTVVQFPRVESDTALVAALKARRHEAQRTLFERYADDVERVLYRVLGPDPEIDDLIHDVFVVAFSSIKKLRQAEFLKSWLVGIAVRKARKTIHKRRLRRIVQTRPPEDLVDWPAATASQDISDALRTTYRILAGLPADERIAFALRHVDGMEIAEVARVTHVSLSTVKRRLARAHTKFVAEAAYEESLVGWLHERSFQR